MIFSIFVSCPRGLEYLLEEELKELGLKVNRVNPQGVYGEANLALIYHLCIWSRIANRIQVILFNGVAHNKDTIYKLCREYPWQTVFSTDKTFAIEFHGSSDEIRNTMFGAQVIKDAIVDHCREICGERPVIAKDKPDIKIHAYLKNDSLTVSFDLTGYSMHQRGYRIETGLAPLKENVAAAMLIRAKWPKLAAEGYALHDPFCGSGTIVIEAAMMAAFVAPGLIRNDQSLQHWVPHQKSLWDKVRAEALKEVKPLSIKLYGTDNNPTLIAKATANAERAGVSKLVNFQLLPLSHCTTHAPKGLLICNPPYGERMGEENELIPLYQELGQVMHANYQGWEAAILTSSQMLAKAIGLRSNKQHIIFNGPLECKLYSFIIDATNQLKGSNNSPLSPGAEMLKNRLQKNFDHLNKWAKRQNISCYRLYDADLPEYAYAIDVYNDHAVLQEYKAPASISPHKAEQRSLEVHQVVPLILGFPPKNLVIKQRKPQKGLEQYEKLNQTHNAMVVCEGDAKLKVNLYDYLDTGLFLDHRLLRLKFAKLHKDTQFLNCFCYTASASVHAALGGAFTTNVDLSNTYLKWAEENFRLNKIDVAKHKFIQEDCLTYLKRTRERFDVIFLDPPSFSNSKRMTETLDIQRDHESLIKAAVHLLYPGGKLYFSTNSRHFKLSPKILEEYSVKDITGETIDLDFKRNHRIHQCFIIMAR